MDHDPMNHEWEKNTWSEIVKWSKEYLLKNV